MSMDSSTRLNTELPNIPSPFQTEPSTSKTTGLTQITPSSFAHAAPSSAHSGAAAGFYSTMVTSLGTGLGFIFTFIPCFGCSPYRTVEQGDVGLITKFGRYALTVDPGLHYINILTDSIRRVDVKMQIGDIPCHDLQDSVVNRESIAKDIEKEISGVAKSWGIKVESILLKDIRFSEELQENLSAAAKARRTAAARIIQAESEVESAKLLREASDILDSKAAMQIRYLDTLRAMAKEGGSKVIFMPPNFGDALNMSSGGAGGGKKGGDLGKAAMMEVVTNM